MKPKALDCCEHRSFPSGPIASQQSKAFGFIGVRVSSINAPRTWSNLWSLKFGIWNFSGALLDCAV
ncbi:MAG: hypothetical protein A2107_01010 [Verrucomicrobia bacterium GWF2_62_7]|nr:MAG: hypothetical protein A2107_01010 [Verrucomicrobia bacterium GWF2_62_7]